MHVGTRMKCSVSNFGEAGIDGYGWWLLLRATAVCNRAMGDAVVAPIAMDRCIGYLTRLKAFLVVLVLVLVLVGDEIALIQDNGLSSLYFLMRVGAMLVGAWVLY